MKKLERFYLKKTTFLFFAITAMLAWIGWTISTVPTGNPAKLTIFGVIFFLLTAGLTWAYLKGETNVQKMLLGSLLLFFIIDYIEILEVHITYQLIPTAIILGITLAVLIVFFICHIRQQQDHTGRSVIVVINQCGVIFILLSVAFLTVSLIVKTITFVDYTFCGAMMLTMFLIVCIETRIGKYKQLRAEHKANGNWNEASREEAKKLFKLS